MIMGIFYHYRSFLKTKFGQSAGFGKSVAAAAHRGARVRAS
jgi:hypothetical protein